MKKTSGPKKREKGPAVPLPPEPLRPRTQNAFPIVGIGASAGGLEAWSSSCSHVPARQRHGLCHRPAPGPDAQGDHARTAPARHRHEGHPGQGPHAGRAGLRLCDPAEQGHVHPARGAAPARAGGAARAAPADRFLPPLPGRRTSRSTASASFSPAWAPTARWGCGPSRRKAGVVLVQEPASAKFDGMPRSAIDAGLADIVAPVEELPGKILAYLQRTPLIATPEPALEDKTQSALEKVVILLRTQTGHDFSLYKKNTLYRRIERRMGIHQIDKIAGYVRYLQENPQELDLLFKELLIGVTSFFRDPAAWEQLRERGHPGAARRAARPARRCGRGCPAARPGRRPIPWPSSSRRRWSRLKPAERFHAADLRHRPGPGRDRQGPPGRLSGQHRRRRVAGAAEPVLRQGRARLPGAQGDPRDGDLRHRRTSSWTRPSPSWTS